ncbi:MAG: phosphoribosylaminoimidazolesuccinocarboxamide synthase [Gammaproteobacteria bacterium]|nr:phosphoribosylaminoimidazolesuccinocarboxamide synthase [Gammaproteobacteria bacterium]
MNALDESLSKYNLIHKGKVRNIYDYASDRLLIVTTDRISAFDFVFEDEIPGKGELLTKMSEFWFRKTRHILDNHIIEDSSINVASDIVDRSMLVKKTEVIPIEAIVRGHLSGSAWKSYKDSKEINGKLINKEYQQYDMLNQPIFTPSTKARIGSKDENISIEKMYDIIGKNLADRVISKSLLLYEYAYDYAKKRGIIIADTKFEFGIDSEDNLILIDEVFTPDCSRFWLYDIDKNHIDHNSFDKQFFRDYLLSINWDSQQIVLPANIKNEIMERYKLAYKLITDNVDGL